MSSDRIITDKGAVPSVARQQALLTLLADEDCGVVEAIREQLTPRGRPQAWLKAHRVHPDPVIRARVRELWDAQARMDADREFLEFCAGHGEHFDLEEACLLYTSPSPRDS